MRPDTPTPRDAGTIRRHYLIERELADRLRQADREARTGLYIALYDELFARVPDHPQLTRKRSPEEQRAQLTLQIRRLAPFLTPRCRFMEIGCGDGRLARALAPRVAAVLAVDVSETISASPEPDPPNLTRILTDGVTLPLPEGAIDLAYSHQLMEHLHPDDAMGQLAQIHRTLAPGGIYLCVTPNRLSGPHDISRGFDAVATGLHLREYTIGELAELMRRAGFGRLRIQVEFKGWAALWPVAPGRWIEGLLERLPPRLRAGLASRFPLRNLLGVRMVAMKPE